MGTGRCRRADIDWDVALALGYKLNGTVSGVAAYRRSGINYRNDGFSSTACSRVRSLGSLSIFSATLGMDILMPVLAPKLSAHLSNPVTSARGLPIADLV
ncbi:hypothetical protein EV129_101381 [Rhizobium azibense]|uniref:Uncharacterized protein n=1 Tax=Rhizobium azibense TaxID=1136135 RepID=A0A4R3S0E2_9HYPH|nr:hypothetical protein EV129_101381 [Rhizobium azibense]